MTQQNLNNNVPNAPENKKINYAQEFAHLTSSGGFWKPSVGKHKIKILSEPIDDFYNQDDGTVKAQWKVQIELISSSDGSGERTWCFPKSNSPISLRGQLIKLGFINSALMGVECTVGVQGVGRDRRYTIFEAL